MHQCTYTIQQSMDVPSIKARCVLTKHERTTTSKHMAGAMLVGGCREGL